MTRPCGEFCNPWPLDTYAPVCWGGGGRGVLLGEGGSTDQLNFFKFSKGFIHFFFHNFYFSFN